MAMSIEMSMPKAKQQSVQQLDHLDVLQATWRCDVNGLLAKPHAEDCGQSHRARIHVCISDFAPEGAERRAARKDCAYIVNP